MSHRPSAISRRELIMRGLKVAAGVSSSILAAKAADHYGLIPPDWTGLWGPGETLT